MTTDTLTPARTLAQTLTQTQVCLSDECCCSLPVEPTPVPGLAIIPTLRPDLGNLDNLDGGRVAYAAYTGCWAVLHLASGHTVTAALDTPAQAREQARLLGLLPIDWTADAETIRAIDQHTKAQVSETWVAASLHTVDVEDDDGEY